ncbi:MAG: hypothetical protein SFU53_04730 [Terrimicrobiaceae bacterium]|nr:hypothetical protein [Terrimicrobiaceae bacterium]
MTTKTLTRPNKRQKAQRNRTLSEPGTSTVFLESLEARIAPAGLDGVSWQAATFGTPILLSAGQGLGTTGGDGGTWLLHVEKGQALVFLTDLNGDSQVNVNEITGISAGNGLKLTSFVDINGDVVTNLNPNGTLTDLDPTDSFRDGRVVLGSTIEGITLRTLNANDSVSFQTHRADTSYSIFGNIFAGGGFGAAGAGLIIDTTGAETPSVGTLLPSVGSIMTGSAVSNQSFSFGISGTSSDVRGILSPYAAPAGTAGGDIIGVHVGEGAVSWTSPVLDPLTGDVSYGYTPVAFLIGGLHAGDGGAGARGGDIREVTLLSDVSGFFAYAGRGGDGVSGGAGGGIINLSDLGSFNALVQLRTGSGGTGFSGAGGNGGTLSLGEFFTTGNVSMILGDGGDGVTAGGRGAGLSTGSFTPQDVLSRPVPMEIVTTYRDAYQIGTPLQVDINQDGIGDMIYVAREPNMLVVRLGVSVTQADTTLGELVTTYGFTADSPTFYLPAPLYSTTESVPLAVAQFGSELGIITASSAAGSRDGIYTFIWNSETNSFDAPVRSAIPFWANRLPEGGAITDIVVGDFDQDAVLDIAYVGQYRSLATDSGLKSDLVVLKGTGDGYFYSDSTLTLLGYSNVYELSKAHDQIILNATGNQGFDYDVILAAQTEGDGSASIRSFSMESGVMEEAWSVTSKFQTRTFNSDANKIEYGNAQDVAVIDFAVTDIDDDGFFDVLSLNAEGVVIAFKGNADGEFSQVLNTPETFAAIKITGEFGVLGQNSDGLDGSFKGIVVGNFDGDPLTKEFALYSIPSDKSDPLGFYQFSIDGFVQNYTGKTSTGDVTSLGVAEFVKPDSVDGEVVAFATYQGDYSDDSLATGFALGNPYVGAKSLSAVLQIGGADSIIPSILEYSTIEYGLVAGDGGDSLLGAGGQGGSFGNGSIAISPQGVAELPLAGITLLIPRAANGFSATFTFDAGDGGNGFTSGGAGGGVSGMGGRYTGSGLLGALVLLNAGDGGDSIQGRGGNGGAISKVSVDTLSTANGGDGGRGMTGGSGGSVVGNGVAGLYDTLDAFVTMRGGDGGLGIKGGGAGGDVSGFRAGFLKLDGVYGGSIDYSGGNGGASIAGTGGNGGSIRSSNPLDEFNFLVGPITLVAGAGGSGLTGGAGGVITNFINRPSIPEGFTPTLLDFRAGAGGDGYLFKGGIGGGISSITVSGTGSDLFISSLEFNRFIAGQGGASFGATGGLGGSISAVTSSATNSSLAIAAGAGGDGLTAGGNGGGISSVTGTAKGIGAGESSKVLVIAGEGGDAYSSTATANSLQSSLLAYGGVVGIGGVGGSIAGFRSTGSLVTVDLIAGNGGNLINSGSALDARTTAGRGGSISGVQIDGSAGDWRIDQAITAYVPAGTKMSSFVTGWLSSQFQGPLDNSQGNVGVVVGASGRVAGGVSPLAGLNGSVSGFKASNIMSMVAGSVERISAIVSISGLNVPTGGVLGAYKTNPIDHSNSPYYLEDFDNDGIYTFTPTASAGVKLMDGAILAISKQAGLGGPRVF